MIIKSQIQRKIRSFVRRAGRITAKQQHALQEYWADHGVSVTGPVLSLPTLFGCAAPCILEIGFGMGEGLLTQAVTHPDYHFIGIDVHKPGVGKLLAGIAEHKLSNVKVFCGDAVEVLQQRIPNHSCNAVLLFFPDPWPKKKHHKRRIVQPDFIQLITAKLLPHGILHIATDWQDYAMHIEHTLSLQTELQRCDHNPWLTRSTTRFAQRGVRLGHALWDFIYVKNE
jgi:tRNA (guanine-N7-)-methyltransferase